VAAAAESLDWAARTAETFHANKERLMAKAKVVVTLKPSLLDAQGRVVQNALYNLGYREVQAVRIGKYIELELDLAEAPAERVREMCDKLLANPVIEDYHVEVVE
jgi:phosphoribosylformylglycinamidine synthase